jgi:hypothetical protein
MEPSSVFLLNNDQTVERSVKNILKRFKLCRKQMFWLPRHYADLNKKCPIFFLYSIKINVTDQSTLPPGGIPLQSCGYTSGHHGSLTFLVTTVFLVTLSKIHYNNINREFTAAFETFPLGHKTLPTQFNFRKCLTSR